MRVTSKIGDCFSITVPKSKNYRAKTLKGKPFCIVRAA